LQNRHSRESRGKQPMANQSSDFGLAQRTGNLAYTMVREQVLAILAPWYYVRQRRAMHRFPSEIGDAAGCGPNHTIELQPTGSRPS